MLSDTQVVQALELAGMEVEQVISSDSLDRDIVVGLIKKVAQHPGADRLRLAQVETGEETLAIVCGASNLAPGQKVAVARVGAVLPGGERIQKAKLRGEVSEGMICSERELRLGPDHDGILVLADDAQVGTPLCDIYPADAEITLKTPANRFDVLSIVGLAREVAAMTGAKLEPLPTPFQGPGAEGPAVAASAQADRYMLARVRVDPAAPPLPDELRARLRAAGVRSLGPVVDVTNYVLLEYGQPIHAFDAGKVQLPVQARLARPGESLRTLDGVERELDPEDLIIADAQGPIALAGVMGGAATEVDEQTVEILLEVAVFDPVLVRKTAKRHGLRTEASARFERGLPVQLSPVAMARALELLAERANGRLVGGVTDQLNEQPRVRSLKLRLARLEALVGFGISTKEAVEALAKLQIESKVEAHRTLVVAEVPWWRTDLKLEVDLVEEVVRVLGYDRVPSTIPPWRPQRLVFDRLRSRRRQVQDALYGAGWFEVMTYSFVSEEQLMGLGLDPRDHLKLKNPLSTEQAYLRSSLLPSHLAVLVRNRMYRKHVAFYEIAQVFEKQGLGEQPREPVRLGLTVMRPAAALAEAKGMLEALAKLLNVSLVVEPAERAGYLAGRTGQVQLGGEVVGWLGQVHPEITHALKLEEEVAHIAVDLSPLLEAATAPQFGGLERYPTIQRDVTVLLPQTVLWRQVQAELAGEPVAFVGDYAGAGLPSGYKSLTLRLTVSHPERTPTEAEAVEREMAVVRRLERRLGAKQRD